MNDTIFANAATASEAALASEFMALAMTADLRARADFAEWVYLHPNSTRPATLADVVDDAADYHDHMDGIYEIFLRAARGEAVKADAAALLVRMAADYARRYVEEA